MGGPKLLPKKKSVARNTYLAQEMWDELDVVAAFHGKVFERMGEKESVSRNDVIEGFLRWALDSYWEDKGGFPTSEKDFLEKAQRHADALKDVRRRDTEKISPSLKKLIK